MQNQTIEQLEITLLLEGVYQRYGYDFRSFARASLERRLQLFMKDEDVTSVPEAMHRILRDENLFSHLVQRFSIPVTEMFRDPSVYRALREHVLPRLKSWPHIKIWHAGCATGEEVYSMAILLAEENLYHRTTIYATDFNDASLAAGQEGIYPLDQVQKATRNYQQSGGRSSFSDYYHAHYGAAAMDAALKERITFANHNLATDASFGEMHLIVCRNVLIYFNSSLQNRALAIFSDSLAHGGFLCLGSRETLDFSDISPCFLSIDKTARIYKMNQGRPLAHVRPG